MTREEAIKHLKWFSEYNEDEYCEGDRIQKGADWYYYINKEDFEAFDMAIKALEQEPCEDCISRKAVIEIVNNPLNVRLEEIIKNLPSIQPKPKTDVLDKIRAEIKEVQTYKMFEGEDTVYVERKDVLAIIDKYKAERE